MGRAADTEDSSVDFPALGNPTRPTSASSFNPEMLDKQRVLAVTKCDLLDEELISMLEPTLPEGIPHVFISAVTGTGIAQLKNLLWSELNKESNQLERIRKEAIVHRPKDIAKLREELPELDDEENFDYEYEDDEDDFDYEYEEEDWDNSQSEK